MGHSHNNRVQSHWFLYGDCFTVDGALDKALNNREERDNAVATNQATQLAGLARLEGAKAKVMLLERKMAVIREELGHQTKVTVEGQEAPEAEALSPKKRLKREFELEELRIQQHEAASELLQAQANAETAERSFQKAIEERAGLTDLINNLMANSPMRALWLSDPEKAAEQAAMLEATFEFMGRIEHSLATQGTLAYDQYRAAMALPTWQSTIRPWLLACKEAVAREGGLLPEELMVSKTIGQRLLALAPDEHRAVTDLIEAEAAFWKIPGPEQQKAFNARPQLVAATEDYVPGLRRPEVYQPIALNAGPAEVAQVRQRRLASATRDIQALLGPAGASFLLGSGEGAPEGTESPSEKAFVPTPTQEIPAVFAHTDLPEPQTLEHGDGEVPVPAWFTGTEEQYRKMEDTFVRGVTKQFEEEELLEKARADEAAMQARILSKAPEAEPLKLKPTWLR